MVAWCDVYIYCVAVRVHSWQPPINSVVQFVRKPNRFWRCVDPINRWPLRSDRPFDRFKYEFGLAGQSKAYVLQQSFGHRSHKLGRSVTYIVGAQAPRSQLNWVRLVICQRTPHLCLCVSGRMYIYVTTHLRLICGGDQRYPDMDNKYENRSKSDIFERRYIHLIRSFCKYRFIVLQYGFFT